MKYISNKTLRAFFVLGGIFVLFSIISFILTQIYHDEIKNYVIGEINKKVNVKVNVKSIDISVLRKFPYITVVLNNSLASSPDGFDKEQFANLNSDTLFSASKIFLQLNLFDIIKQNYSIKKIHIQNGKINILTDRHGLKNYMIFREDNKTQGSRVIELEGVKITGFELNYANLSENIHGSAHLNDIVLKGMFATAQFSLDLSSDLVINKFENKKFRISDKVNTGIEMNLDVKDSVFSFKQGILTLNDIDINLMGIVKGIDSPVLDIRLSCKDVDIGSLLESIPFQVKGLDKIRSSGKIDITADISGKANKKKLPDIRSSFKLTNGHFALPEKSFKIDGISFKGTYTNGRGRELTQGTLKISEYQLKSGPNNLSGTLEIENLGHPAAKGHLSGTFEAKILSRIIKVPGFKFDKGLFHPDLTITTILSRISDFKPDYITSLGFHGTARVDSVSGTIPGVKEYIKKIDGQIRFEGDTWFPQIYAKTDNSDLHMDIEADHVLGFFFYKRSSLWLKGNLESDYLDLKRFISGNGDEDSISSVFPKKVYMKLYYSVKGIEYGKFKGSNASSMLDYSPGHLSYSGLNMDAMNGKIRSTGTLSEDLNGRITIRSLSDMQKIDINNLFFTFNNFGQKFIIDENLRGLISGKLESSIILNPDLSPDYSTLSASSDVIITNGELVNFEPVKDLSRYVAISELEHIKFSTLQNSILINDSKVYIPQMDIKSSAFNITTSGTHRFDNYFEYKLKVQLSQLLAKKVGRINNESGYVENNSQGANLFLSITGTPDDYKIKYDRKEALNKIRTDLQREKTVLKTIFSEEFGSGENDPAGTEIQKMKTGDFSFQFEEDSEKSPVPVKTSKKNTKEQEFEFILD